MARQKQPKAVHQLTAAQFDTLFQTEERLHPLSDRAPLAGRRRLPALRQSQGLRARVRPSLAVRAVRAGDGYRFSHLTGTIFENTNKPLKDWFRVIHLMLVSKKGMSALQIYRYMGFGSYETAWLMCHKVRVALD